MVGSWPALRFMETPAAIRHAAHGTAAQRGQGVIRALRACTRRVVRRGDISQAGVAGRGR